MREHVGLDRPARLAQLLPVGKLLDHARALGPDRVGRVAQVRAQLDVRQRLAARRRERRSEGLKPARRRRQDLGQVDRAHGGPPARGAPPICIRQELSTAVHDLGAGRLDRIALVGEHRRRRVRVLDRERPAEAAALVRPRQLDQLEPAHCRSRRSGASPTPRHAAASGTSGGMRHGAGTTRPRPRRRAAHEQLRELEDPRRSRDRCRAGTPARGQRGYPTHARRGRRDDGLVRREDLDEAARQRQRLARGSRCSSASGRSRSARAGKTTSWPSRSSTSTVARPASGKSVSPMQVTKSATRSVRPARTRSGPRRSRGPLQGGSVACARNAATGSDSTPCSPRSSARQRAGRRSRTPPAGRGATEDVAGDWRCLGGLVDEQRLRVRRLDVHHRLDHRVDLALDVVRLVDHDSGATCSLARVRPRAISRMIRNSSNGSIAPTIRSSSAYLRLLKWKPPRSPSRAGARRSARRSSPADGGRCRRAPAPSGRGAGRASRPCPSRGDRCCRSPARRTCTRRATACPGVSSP